MSVRAITWRQAERIYGMRLDRRRRYALDGKRLLETITHTQSCSGCFEGGEYMGLAHNYLYDDKANCRVGSGCSECGHTGKRRFTEYVPFTPPQESEKP